MTGCMSDTYGMFTCSVRQWFNYLWFSVKSMTEYI